VPIQKLVELFMGVDTIVSVGFGRFWSCSAPDGHPNDGSGSYECPDDVRVIVDSSSSRVRMFLD